MPPGTLPPPAFSLRLFGPFEARLGDAPLPRLRTRKGQWLLALLALRHPRPVERGVLCAALWPDSGEAEALAGLRRALTDLRAAFGTQAHRLRSPTPRSVSLDLGDGGFADVVAFDAAAERVKNGSGSDLAACAQIVALRRTGPLLPDCFEEWVGQERAPREQTFLRACETLAEAALARGAHDEADDLLQQALRAEPLRETALRARMRVLAAGGNVAAAMFAYREFRLFVRQEMTTEPDGETTALYRRLRDQARERSQIRPARPARPPGAAPPPPPPPRNLPCPLTPFVGRRSEVRGLAERFAAGARLVTLTGAGGVGKTRLAIETAGEMAEDHEHGVWFADLSPLLDPALVCASVAAALSINVPPSRAPLDALRDYLRPRSLLLVVDNCEHVIDACAHLAGALLPDCPHLCILATSRRALGITGEIIWRVSPLALPEPHLPAAPPDLAAVLMGCEAVQLFAARAEAAVPGWALTPGNAQAVLQVCRRLDGIPFALELAAARLAVLSVEQIAARLDDVFRLLPGGSRAALPHQQTLRALMDWSYVLLSPAEQRLLRRLSVFAGGWTLAAAEAVCGAAANPASAGWEVLDLLGRLVDMSLVQHDEQPPRSGGGTDARYRLLETVRQYARNRLEEAGEADAARQRHGAWFLVVAEKTEPDLSGPNLAAGLDHLEAEHDNLRAALAWYAVQATHAAAGTKAETVQAAEAAAETGLRLTGALQRFWQLRGYLSEGREHARRALDPPGARAPTQWRAKVLSGAGSLAWKQGDYEQARALFEECLVIRRAQNDARGVATSLNNLGILAYDRGDRHAAGALYEESLAIGRHLNDKRRVSMALNNLAILALDRADYVAAGVLFEEALAIDRECGDRNGEATVLENLGFVARLQNDRPAARARYARALAINESLGDRAGQAANLCALALVAQDEGDAAGAGALHERSLRLRRDIGDKRGIAYSLEGMARLLAARPGETVCAAVRLCAAAAALRAFISVPLPLSERRDHDDVLARTRAALGDDGFAQAWAQGRSWTTDEAVACALSAPAAFGTSNA